MKWDQFRERSANDAGLVFTGGNLAVMVNTFYENQADISGIMDEPDGLIAGGIFLLGSINMLINGKKNKGMLVSQIAAFSAVSILLGIALKEDKMRAALGAGAGALAALSSSVVSGYKLLNERKEKKEEAFQENKRSIFKEYPQLGPMMIGFAANVGFVVGNYLDNNPWLVGAGLAWCAGTALVAASKQTNNSNPVPCGPA